MCAGRKAGGTQVCAEEEQCLSLRREGRAGQVESRW